MLQTAVQFLKQAGEKVQLKVCKNAAQDAKRRAFLPEPVCVALQNRNTHRAGQNITSATGGHTPVPDAGAAVTAVLLDNARRRTRHISAHVPAHDSVTWRAAPECRLFSE